MQLARTSFYHKSEKTRISYSYSYTAYTSAARLWPPFFQCCAQQSAPLYRTSLGREHGRGATPGLLGEAAVGALPPPRKGTRSSRHLTASPAIFAITAPCTLHPVGAPFPTSTPRRAWAHRFLNFGIGPCLLGPHPLGRTASARSPVGRRQRHRARPSRGRCLHPRGLG